MNNLLDDKKRSSNWSVKETERLKELCLSKRDILEAKHKDPSSERKKKRVWDEISTEINATYPSVKRTSEEARKKWANLKNFAKKKNASSKRSASATGGGPPASPVPAVLEDIVQAYSKSDSFNGISGGIDTDVLSESSSEV